MMDWATRSLGACVIACWGGVALAEDTQTLLTGYCKAEGLDEAQCSCAQDSFAAQTAEMSPEDVMASAFLLGQGGLSPQQMMTAIQSVDQARLQTVVFQLDPIQTEIEQACAKLVEVAAVPGLDLSAPPRERMITICEQDIGIPDVCTCFVDGMEEKMGPQIFELVVDIRTAEAMGAEDGFAVVAEERGLTKGEAEEALMAVSGPLMSSIGAIMACMPAEMQQMMNGDFQGMVPLPTE